MEGNNVSFQFFSPTKIHFGNGYRKKIGIVSKKYGKKCLIVRTKKKLSEREVFFNDIISQLEHQGIKYVIYDKVISNPSTEVVERGVSIAEEKEVDFIIGYGGGSALDTAKSISLLIENKKKSWELLFKSLSNPFSDGNPLIQSLPLIAITTTSGTGSHITQASVISDLNNNEKNTLFHSTLFPNECIVDPELMNTVPSHVTSATGFDALCHAFESFLNPNASRLTRTLSLQSMNIIVQTLPKLIRDINNQEYRELMAYADTLSGICLSNAGAEAPHPIGEIINGYIPELSHGETLAFVYPSYCKYIIDIIPERFEHILNVFEFYIPKDTNLSKNDQAFYMMKNFLIDIDLLISSSSIKLDEQLIYNVTNKLTFNLPLTNAEGLKEVFKNSI